MDRESKFKIIDTYFPNGSKYMTHVFEGDTILRLKRYYSTGELESVCEYENGNIINKKIFKKNNRICEYFSYHYDNGNLSKIIKEEEYLTSEVIFKRNHEDKLTDIIIYVNGILSKKINFTYNNENIVCTELAGSLTKNYTLKSPPIANEKWLCSYISGSLVMRKLKFARQKSA